jgi:hypothetical protein
VSIGRDVVGRDAPVSFAVHELCQSGIAPFPARLLNPPEPAI